MSRKKLLKQRIAKRYNARVIPKSFEKGNLVLRHVNIGLPPPRHGKLATNWEGPYKVIKTLGKGAYKLATLSSSKVPITWNSSNLRRFYT